MCLLVDKPRLGDILHPGADERNCLSGDEQAKIAVAEGAKRLPQVRPEGSGGCCNRNLRLGGDFLQFNGWHGVFLGRDRVGHPSFQNSALQWNFKFNSGEIDLAEDKLYKAEYLGSGTFIISK